MHFSTKLELFDWTSGGGSQETIMSGIEIYT